MSVGQQPGLWAAPALQSRQAAKTKNLVEHIEGTINLLLLLAVSVFGGRFGRSGDVGGRYTVTTRRHVREAGGAGAFAAAATAGRLLSIP